MSIVSEAKSELKAQKKAEKVEKTIKVSTLIKVSIYTIILLALGAYSGIMIDRAITHTINSQVQTKTAEQVKVFTNAQE
jgi:hypothetical protein